MDTLLLLILLFIHDPWTIAVFRTHPIHRIVSNTRPILFQLLNVVSIVQYLATISKEETVFLSRRKVRLLSWLLLNIHCLIVQLVGQIEYWFLICIILSLLLYHLQIVRRSHLLLLVFYVDPKHSLILVHQYLLGQLAILFYQISVLNISLATTFFFLQ